MTSKSSFVNTALKSALGTVVIFGVLSAGAASAQTPAAAGTGGATGGAAGSAGAAAGAPGGASGNTPAAPPSNAPAAAAPAAPAAPPAAPAAPAEAKPPAPPAAPQVINVTPPATLTPTTTTSPPEKASAGGAALGLSPSTPTLGAGTNLSAKQAESLTPTTAGAADEWKFDFHGYMRAPFRMSWGPPSPVIPPVSSGSMAATVDPATRGGYPIGAPAPPGLQLHSPPRVPGYLYTTWEYTNTVGGPWAQLNFSYGNSRAMMTVIVDSYNQTDGSYRNIQAQQGIDMAFLTLNFPDALGDLGTLVWNIGTFQNRYGTAGKYDGGMYETYLFGRTHISGETLTANLTNVDPGGDWAISLEHGFGAKINLVPFLNNPYYQVLSNPPGMTSQPYLSGADAEYLPYSGPVPQGSTFVHHAHIGAKYQKLLTFGLHYLYCWTPDDNWDPRNSTGLVNGNTPDSLPRANGPIQGSMAIAGAEVRLSGGVYGDGYLGYSHIDARNINALADAIEVLHSYGGYQFKQNFFGKTYNRHNGFYQGPQNETGTLDNISFQYSFSFGQLARYPEDFWGDGPDLVLTVFGLLTIVDSKAPPTAAAHAIDWNMSTKKLKWGFDALYTPLDWLGFGGRFDYVQPDLDAAYARVAPGTAGGSQLNFGVANLRAVIKTQFVTHEAVTLGYAHYFLNDGAYPAYPYDWVAKADANLVSLNATMWW